VLFKTNKKCQTCCCYHPDCLSEILLHHLFFHFVSGQNSSSLSLTPSCKKLLCGIRSLVPLNKEIMSLKDSLNCPVENSFDEDSLLPSQSPQLIQLCSKQFGYFQHFKDCQKFVRCSFGDPFVMRCPPGTLWNQECKCCDWPFRVNCTPGNYIKLFEYNVIIKGISGDKPTATDVPTPEPITTPTTVPSTGMLKTQYQVI
jgi:hypothetical protein